MTPLPLVLWSGAGRLVPGLMERAALAAHARQGADPARAGERRGQATRPRPDGPLIWLHAASLGEVMAAATLVPGLAARGTVLMTTTTQAGAQAVARAAPAAIHQFLPADSVRAACRFLDHWRPDAGIVTESDLWPNLLAACGGRRPAMPLALVNARPSRGRDRWPRSQGALLSRFEVICCQTEEVRRRIAGLGLPAERLAVTGDLKAAAPPLTADPAALAALRQAVGGRPVWLALSTHPDDEAPVLAAHRALTDRLPGALLIIAPRHPDARRSALMAALPAGTPVRSRGGLPEPGQPVYLADTLGEVGTLLPLGRLAYLGGGFGPEGGHNPYEAARAGLATLSGPATRNAGPAWDLLTRAGGARIVPRPEDLAQVILRLMSSDDLTALRTAARAAMQGASDSAARTVDRLDPMLPGRLAD
jgi:3-deoxy-D-manno-octulosonic-acid transferase